jgi:putative redox protein
MTLERPESPKALRTVSADLSDGMAVEIRNGRHVWYADEPPSQGGTDTGPDPYEMLLGALAACTCITVFAYAKRKGIDLHSVSARFHYEKVHSDDCRDCETDEVGWLDHVRSEVFVEGTFDEEQRKRLMEVAVRCPVHKTLAHGVTFTDHVVAG